MLLLEVINSTIALPSHFYLFRKKKNESFNSEIKMAVEHVCQFQKYGYCKFAERCQNRNVLTICDTKNCEIINCSNRHPHVCKFYEAYGRCKFGLYCQYKHVDVVKGYEDTVEKMKKTLLEEINQKFEATFKSYKDRILQLEESMKQLEIKLEGMVVDTTPTNTTQSHSLSVVYSNSRQNTTLISTLLSLQTRPGSSCCDRLCRLDMVDDPDYDKCCLHRCRKPWT